MDQTAAFLAGFPKLLNFQAAASNKLLASPIVSQISDLEQDADIVALEAEWSPCVLPTSYQGFEPWFHLEFESDWELPFKSSQLQRRHVGCPLNKDI